VRLVAEEAVKRKLAPHAGRETIRILLRSYDLKPWRKENVLRSGTGPSRPLKPGNPAGPDSTYERCVTANVFGAVEPKAGRHFAMAAPDRCAAQFAQLMRRLVGQYPSARTIHLVMDNLNIHCRKSLVDSFGEREGGKLWDRFTVHYTPKHGSWLNQAEIELSLYSRQCLSKRRIPDLGTLKRETRIWNRQTDRKRTRINWQFTRKKARKLFHCARPRSDG
jgi:hypothetical protein